MIIKTTLLLSSLALFWVLSPTTEKIEKEVEQKQIKENIWHPTQTVPTTSPIVIRTDTNSSLNKKPTVMVYGYTIGSAGEVMEIKSEAKDEDGKIVSYVWKEGEKILGSSPTISPIFTEGEHTITLEVKDNQGAKAQDKITIDILSAYQKKVFSRHKGCGCTSKTYTYYNDEGNISKEISETDNGVIIEEYTYDGEGHLQSKHYVNYYDNKNDLQVDKIVYYDPAQNIIEESGQEFDYRNETLVDFHRKYQYDANNNVIEERYETEGLVNNISHYTYNKTGERDSYISENYEEEVLNSKDEEHTIRDDKGNRVKNIHQITDANGNTKTNYIELFTYDDRGNLLSSGTDNDGDGEIDYSNHFVYNENNQRIEEDYGESHYYYQYNPEGEVIQEQRVYQDQKELTHYEYDENHHQILTKSDNDGDGVFEDMTKRYYDDLGKLSHMEEIVDGKFLESRTYNEQGDIIEYKNTYNTISYIYDESTQQLQKEINSEGEVNYSYNEQGVLILKTDEKGEVLYRLDER